MKRIGGLFPVLASAYNIDEAITNSSKEKDDRWETKIILNNRYVYSKIICELLRSGTWIPSRPRYFKRYDVNRHKYRDLAAPIYFPDQIIHHALMQVTIPAFMRGMYFHSYSTVPKRGPHKAVHRVERWLKEDHKNTKYCCQLDISKFYKNINHKILYGFLMDTFKEQKVNRLFFKIIHSHKEIDGIHGLPIGYYTSQWLANFYLQRFDHWLKENAEVKYYVRYADDMLIFGPNKRELHALKRDIDEYMRCELDLRIKDNWQVYPTDIRPVNFLGYQIYQDHTLIGTGAYLRTVRKMRRIQNKHYITKKEYNSLSSRRGIILAADAHRLLKDFDRTRTNAKKKVIDDEG